MNVDNSVIDGFVQTWVGELSQAVEMFSGVVPEVSSRRIPIDPAGDTDSLLWVEQGYVRGGDFSLWVGTDEATWSALGALLGDGDAESFRANYLEILGQAHHGAANALSSPGSEFTCREGEPVDPPNFDPLAFAMFSVEIEGEKFSPVLLVIDLSAEIVIEPTSSPTKTAPPAEDTTTSTDRDISDSPILERLLDLELPLSVGLGTTFVAIKDALKFSNGLVVPLNRDVSETIDLYVHGTLVARGDVVLVRGNYGIRITEIVNRLERLRLCRG